MDEAVENGVGEGGIVELSVPVGEPATTGDHHRAPADAVVEDFEEVASRAVSMGARPQSSRMSSSMRPRSR